MPNEAFDTPLTDIEGLVKRSHSAFATGKSRDIEWRKSQLVAIKQMTLDNEKALLSALKQDLNKCEQESWISEIGFVTTEVDHTLKHLKKWAKPCKVSTPMVAMPGKSFVYPEPLGCVLIIGAWNYPYQLVLAPLIAAIAAGNTAIIKPSELSTHTAKLIAELVPKYLDNDAFSVVNGGKEQTSELLKHKFDHILYTGGETVGKIVMRAASDYLTPVTLELGGKSPCVVDSSADLNVTAARIVWAKWLNAGQTCVAPDYVLVPASLADTLVSKIKTKLTEFYGQDPAKSPDYGRIVNQRHHARLCNYLEGHNVAHGGQADASDCYLAPTIVINPATDSALMQEEIFGPILPIITVDDVEASIDIINSRPKPLSMYVFTKDKAFEQRLLERTSAGMVCVNDGFMFAVNPELPFGGVGNSGMGAYHGKYGFDTFSHMKTVMKRSFLFDVAVRYPPFSKTKLNLMKKLL
ncbi:aldehyde dehydrogenase family protein [Aestuariibacter salexigens]|uniref:aldehyde dehydrogenase family protein n=1 Tax=Aestuariibacter salexigens TaxID=226010 RepID=UPI00047E5410|nr:aldehyde dehydrogenase family protein [Aestuariibacter salexigens]